jgi:TetR/AcrR family transcriptional regulator, transcriptional repressor for nem operon
MPWPKDHKKQTRERIVEAAAAAFRAGGVSAVRVEDVMAKARLTHGGFYAHFPSKDDLLREALEHAGRQTDDILSKLLADLPAKDQIHAGIDTYLSGWHAAHPERGCPIAALAPELARARGKTRRALSRSVRGRVEWVRRLLAKQPDSSTQDPRAVAVVACLVGGVILARAADMKDSAAVLQACRDFLHAALEDADSRHTRSS